MRGWQSTKVVSKTGQPSKGGFKMLKGGGLLHRQKNTSSNLLAAPLQVPISVKTSTGEASCLILAKPCCSRGSYPDAPRLLLQGKRQVLGR